MSEEVSGKPVVLKAEVEQRLLECYPHFVGREPHVLHAAFPHLSLAACQDIVHEAFLRVGRSAQEGRLPPVKDVRAYLRTTIRNLARDQLRREGRIALNAGEDFDSIPHQRDPVREEQDLLRGLVRPAIEQMPASKQRQVVDLQSQGFNDVQIAGELGIAPHRLHNLRNKAVTHLRHILAEHIRADHRKKGTR
ncbi:RNA polymerase sigma factor [Streptomyces sp. DH12]|uniref:RNA polymerase sigma factor n=1 Tax=Streptomyces sp. DH12 TaxID=2857010 RepID=UPI001E64C9B3|nr:sigma-70 family RNA polymerase sigma factor [Streptomyces sp. DH12]